MAIEQIKDKNNNIIALLKTEGYFTVLTTVTGKLLGRYNPKFGPRGATFDASNNFVGEGNQVMRLLK